MRKLVFLLVFISCSLTFYGQTDSTFSVCIKLGGNVGSIIPHNKWASDLLTGSKRFQTYSLSIGWQAKGDSVSASDEMFGRPNIEAGMIIKDFHNVPFHSLANSLFENVQPSSAGQMITPYASINRALLRNRFVEAGYYFSQGIGISTRPYDPETNPENSFIGSRFSILVGLGLYCNVKVDKNWSLGASASLHHYSNGRLTFPNYGINSFEAGIHAAYVFNPDSIARGSYRWNKIKKNLDDGFAPHFYVDIATSWLPRALLAEYLYTWNRLKPGDHRYRTGKFPLYHSFSFSAALMYKYGRKFASGLGLEYIYAPIGDNIKYWEELNGYQIDKQSPHGLSAVAHHEVAYKNVAAHFAVGYYILREPKQLDDQESPVFETAGLRYYLPFASRKMYVGYNIRARAFTADCFQFSVGYKIGKPDYRNRK